jgi:DNA-binding NarL/FixJ family response regulator
MRAAWDSALEPDAYPRRAEHGLDAPGVGVLRALADGLADEAGARRLGVSSRTYRRRVAEVLSAMDAGSRFQAGVCAGRLSLAD